MEKKHTYEAMFLLDAGKSDFDAVSEPIRGILDRQEAEVLSIKPWDERKLAYDVKGRRRGLYVLAYFRLYPQRVKEVEHDCRLNERILRVLVIRREAISDELISTETPAEVAARRSEERKAAEQRAERRAAQDARETTQDEPTGEQPTKDDKPLSEQEAAAIVSEKAEPASGQAGKDDRTAAGEERQDEDERQERKQEQD